MPDYGSPRCHGCPAEDCCCCEVWVEWRANIHAEPDEIEEVEVLEIEEDEVIKTDDFPEEEDRSEVDTPLAEEYGGE
jgi:hypothetical protein